MSNGDTLSVKLEVQDSFTSHLNKFKTSLNATESAFNKFVTKFEQSSQKAEKALDSLNQKMDKVAQKMINSSNNVANDIIKASDRVNERQQKQMNDLLNKYVKMGGDIQTIFKNIQKEADQLNKGGVKVNMGGAKKSSEENNNGKSLLGGVFTGEKTESLLGGILSGNFTKVLGSMSLIGSGITGVAKAIDSLENWTQQGYNVLNTLSTGLFSVSGLEKGIEDSSSLETSRVALDTLYGSKGLGGQYYNIGIGAAQNSTFGETDVIQLQKKLAGAKLSYKQKDLETLLGLAALKPELGVSHVGFSLVDAMYGRTSSLKTNYMIDNKEVQDYLKKLQGSADAHKWKDAFNKKGAVNNKQEYFDLLINYIQKETHYGELAKEYASTFQGQVSRIKGYWEILRADLLGVDRETGNIKGGSLFDSVKQGLDSLQNWLKQSDTQNMMDKVGQGLGTAAQSILGAFNVLLKNIDLQYLGDVIKRIGESVGKIVNDLASNPEFLKMIDNLPDLIERILGGKTVEVTNTALTDKDLANKNYVGAGFDMAHGLMEKARVTLGTSSTKRALTDNEEYASYSTGQKIAQALGFNPNITWDEFWHGSNPQDKLTRANAWSALNDNSKLTDGQRYQLKDMIDATGSTTFNVTIGTIQADNFDEIVASIQKYQADK